MKKQALSQQQQQRQGHKNPQKGRNIQRRAPGIGKKGSGQPETAQCAKEQRQPAQQPGQFAPHTARKDFLLLPGLVTTQAVLPHPEPEVEQLLRSQCARFFQFGRYSRQIDDTIPSAQRLFAIPAQDLLVAAQEVFEIQQIGQSPAYLHGASPGMGERGIGATARHGHRKQEGGNDMMFQGARTGRSLRRGCVVYPLS